MNIAPLLALSQGTQGCRLHCQDGSGSACSDRHAGKWGCLQRRARRQMGVLAAAGAQVNGCTTVSNGDTRGERHPRMLCHSARCLAVGASCVLCRSRAHQLP